MSQARWLRVFCGVLGCGPAFARAFADELEPGLRRAGLDPEGFFLAPPPNPKIQYTAGAGRVEADLVGPDNLGHPVTVGFACASHPGERLDPAKPLGPGCSLRAEWLELPIEALQMRYLGRPAPLLDLPPDLAPRVDWARFTWPEVPLAVVGDAPLDPSMFDALEKRLESIAVEWNQHNPERLLKSIGPMRPRAAGGCEIFIDFGAAPELLLITVLRAFAESARLDARIIIGQGTAL